MAGDEGIRIDALDPTVNPSFDHEFAAMKDGLTVKLTLDQIRKLIAAIYDPQQIASDSFDRAKHTGEQSISTISGLQSIIDDLETTVSQLAIHAADSANAAQFLGPTGNRFADSFDAPLTYVDVAGATNLNISVPGLLKPTATSTIEQTATHTGYVTSGNTVSASNELTPPTYAAWKAFNKSALGEWSTSSGVTAATLTYQFGSAKTIDTYFIRSVSAESDRAPSAWTLEGSNDGSSWTAIDTRTGQIAWGAAGEQRSFAIASPMSFTHYRLNITAVNGDNLIQIDEVGYQSALALNNLTVRSTSFTAVAAPSKMKGLLRVKEVAAAAAGTDYTLECSRDGGTTWAAMTLTEMYAVAGLLYIEAAETSVSGQPSGTAPRWRFKTFNNKNVELHDLYLYWT